MKHTHGRKLVETVQLSHSYTGGTDQFTDDVTVYTTTRGALDQIAAEFARVPGQWDLTVSLEKNKGMAMGRYLTPIGTSSSSQWGD